MTTLEIFAQVFSVLAMIASVLSMQPKSYYSIMWLQALCSVCFCTSFIFFYLNGEPSALTAAFINGFNILRDLVFMYVHKKEKNIAPVAIGYCLVIVELGIISWGGPVSLLYIIGMVLCTLSFATKNPQQVRILIMVCLPFLFAYDVINASIGGVISDVGSMISSATAYIRYRKQGMK